MISAYERIMNDIRKWQRYRNGSPLNIEHTRYMIDELTSDGEISSDEYIKLISELDYIESSNK